jgi:hypothetical protein
MNETVHTGAAMERHRMLVPLLILLGLPCSSGVAGDTPGSRTAVATVTKAVNVVSRKPEGGSWLGANKGDRLQSGDMLKTGDGSFAIVKFSDKSLLHVQERAELVIRGTVRDKALSKTVEMGRGAVGFTIPHQRPGEEFRFTSPTSVASVRGTSGFLAATDSADTLTVLDGTIAFRNKFSAAAVDVIAGYTGISSRNGTVDSKPSSPDQRRAAEDALRTGDQQKRLEFELRSGSGKSKKLRIDYRE